MKHERIDFFIKTLGELSAYLVKVKHHYDELETKAQISDAVERYLDGFFIPERKNVSADALPPADLQRNNIEVTERQPWTKKETGDMPYLKDLKHRVTKDGIHQFRYRRDGYNLSFNSKIFEVAKKKAYNFIKSIKKTIQKEADVMVNSKTLGFVAEAWLELKKSILNIQSWRTYESVYRNHIAPVFAKRNIKSLLPLDLQPFFNELFKSKGKTCENAKIILNGIFDYAVANRLCPSNPMKGVIVQKHFRQRGSALNDDQLDTLKMNLALFKDLETAGLIILYSGIRGAELESIKFDWDNGTFTVKNAKLKQSQKVDKNNLYRTVPIFPGLYNIKSLIEKEDWRTPGKLLSSRFSAAIKICTVKDLRHTFISRARESGIDNELVNVWTGHLPGKNQTANTYTHFSIDYQKKIAKKIKPY